MRFLSSPVCRLRAVAGMVQGFAHGHKKKTNNFNGPHENTARCHICIDFVLMALQLEEGKKALHGE